MPQHSTIAVTGATGFVGAQVVRELLDRGHAVRGLVRSRDKAKSVLPASDRLRLIHADIMDPTGLAGLTAGVTACLNTLGLIRESAGQTFKKIHVDATRVLVNACRDAGVKRFVQISAVGVSDEGKAAYQRTKYEGEQIVKKSDLEWTILRPSLIHGPRSEFIKLAKGWCSGEKQPWFFLPYFSRGRLSSEDVPLAAIYREPASVQPVAVEDVAWAGAECLAREDSIGEIYNIVGPEVLTWPQLLEHMRDHIPGANVDLNPMGVPSEAAAIQALVASKIGIGSLLPFDHGMAVMGAIDSTASLDKARIQLGFAPRGFKGRFNEYAGAIG